MATKRGEEEWGTVVLSDDPLSERDTDTSDPSSHLLEVPVLTDDVLTEMEEAASRSTQVPQHDEEMPQRGEPGSYVECETCGKRVRVKRDGTLALHGKCERPAERGNRFANLPAPKPAPKKARDFCISVLAWTVEEGSAQVLSRATSVPAQDIPTELPDADEMIGPPLDIVWPHIPDSVQDLITVAADNSQLLSCLLLWAEWGKTLRTWSQDARAYQRRLAGEQSYAPSSEPQSTPYGTVTPFRPAAPQ